MIIKPKKPNNSINLVKLSYRISGSVLGVFIIGYLLVTYLNPGMGQLRGEENNKEWKTEKAYVQGECYNFILKNHELYSKDAEGKGQSIFLEEPILDIKCYDLDRDDSDELLVLTLSQKQVLGVKQEFGEFFELYDLSLKEDMLDKTLCYSNDLSLVNPFMLEAGRLDQSEPYGNIFVGVYKDTKYYSPVINRPFFFSWNGRFLERKWTGSFLSQNELMDLVFLDFVGDGVDEIAVLEKLKDGTSQVALYKWLSFGFQYLIKSKKTYNEACYISVEKSKDHTSIWIHFKSGNKEKVSF